MSTILENLKYTKEHEWAQIEGDVMTIGITDFAQSSLGDIVYIELPEVGQQLEENESFGVVESVKSVSDLYSPAQGEVLEVNQKIVDEPEIVNTDAYKNWFIKLKLSSADASGNLLSSEQYKNHIDSVS